jgi:hypothetical protein
LPAHLLAIWPAILPADSLVILLADWLAILHANCWLVCRPAKLPAGLLGKLNGSPRVGSFCQKSILVADSLCPQWFAQRACGAMASGSGSAGIWVRFANSCI